MKRMQSKVENCVCQNFDNPIKLKGADVHTLYHREKIKCDYCHKYVMNIKWNIEKHSINCIHRAQNTTGKNPKKGWLSKFIIFIIFSDYVNINEARKSMAY